jgi:hypothetical protein
MNLATRIALFCLVGGLGFTLLAMGAGHFGWWWLSGIVTAAALAPVVRYGPRSMTAQFGAIFLVLVIVGLGCTLSEGALFFPQTRAQIVQTIAGGIVNSLIESAVLVALAGVLRLANPASQEIPSRPFATAALMVLASAASYVVYYLIFGSITFLFFTKKYYPHATEQVAALGLWFWGYQLARGLLMTLAVVPVIYTLRLPRGQTALIVGLMIWIVGGAAPLLVPNGVMVAAQRSIHIVEIMTQNVSLGATAVWLLRPKSRLATCSTHLTGAVHGDAGA